MWKDRHSGGVFKNCNLETSRTKRNYMNQKAEIVCKPVFCKLQKTQQHKWQQMSLMRMCVNSCKIFQACNEFFRLHKSECLKACSRLSCGWASVEREWKIFYEEWIRTNVSILRHPVELHNGKVTIRFPLTRPHMHTHTDHAAYLSIIAFHHKLIQTKVCKRETQRGRRSQTHWLCSKTYTNIG